MKKELEQLMKLAGTSRFDAKLEAFHRKYKNDPGAKKEIAAFIKSGIRESGKRIEQIENAINMRALLGDSPNTIPMSYIADKYFKKTRQWLYQRVNGNIVNGKVSRFTEEELKIFVKALNDISDNLRVTAKKIDSLSVNG